MAASDDLRKLADRAKAAEDHAATAKTQARTELQKTVTNGRASAEAEAKKFETKTQAATQQVSDSWNDVQRSWTAHIDKARKDMDHRKAEFDASNATSDADWAEWNAELTIDYAYSAIEEAESAVLDAILARREADEAAVAAHR
jgi:hypothetical protein